MNVADSKYREIASRPEIYPMYRIELLDHYENVILDITDYITADNAGSISINYQQGVRRTCTFTLIDNDGIFIPKIDGLIWINRRFKLFVGLKDIYTDDVYWFSQGVFCMLDPSIDRTQKTVTLNGVDKYGFLGAETGYNQYSYTHVIPEGTSIVEIIEQTLWADMGNANIMDRSTPIVDNELLSWKCPYEIDKSPSTYASEIFIEVGNIMGADTYYDTDGHLRYDNGTLDLSYSTQDSLWDFTDKTAEYINPVLTLSPAEVINCVTVSSSNSNDTDIYSYTAENHNPISSTSIENIGRKAYYEESSNLGSEENAKDYAEYLLNQKSILQSAITFECSLLPHLDVNKIITIEDEYFGYTRERFIIQSITLPLDASSTMSITASNVSDLPYYELREGSTSST